MSYKSDSTTSLIIGENMTYKQIKSKHNLTDASIAEMFSYKTYNSFANSSAKKRIEKGLENFYNRVINQ